VNGGRGKGFRGGVASLAGLHVTELALLASWRAPCTECAVLGAHHTTDKVHPAQPRGEGS
jgi:hypothetical protein